MAKGKFSQPRSPRREDRELDLAFQELNGQPVDPTPQATPVAAPNPSIEKNKKIVLISLCCVALVILVGLIATVSFLASSNDDDGLILNNVTVAGVNLGGLTPQQAAAELHKVTDWTYTSEDMVIEMPGGTLKLSPKDTGVHLDVDAAVQAAYDYGRVGTREERNAARAKSLVSVHHIALLPYLNLDTDYIRQTLDSFGKAFNSEFMESSVNFEGEKPSLAGELFDENAPCQTLLLNPGKPGRSMDIDKLYNQVLDAYSFNTFLVKAEESAPAKLPQPLDLDALFEEYCSAPVDAAMDMETFEVTAETYGYSFDLEKAKKLLEEAAPGAVIGIPMEYVVPEITAEKLQELLFRDVLGSYETEHTNDANRNNNLELACKALHNYVLNPGDIFDYNKVLGERTEEAGYKPAGAYNGGQTVAELGGGICQVSSTLYYCTLVADLEIVTRRPHSFVSSYMPMGMDATVSWGGPDFRFKNNTNYPIRIEAEVSGGYVRIKLLGTDEKDYYIKMEYEVIDHVSPDTIYEEYEPNNSKGYKDGQVIQHPYTGYSVKTYKCKYDKETDELISRDYDTYSTYQKRDKIVVKIVTAETTPPETEAPTETPTEPTETPTEAPTEAPTETPTAAPTEAPTEAPSAEG